MAIHQTDMFRINSLNSTNGFIKDDYYYAQDLGRLYKALSTSACQQQIGVYMVASDTDRRYNVPKVVGTQYYCVETNQLWAFSIDNAWDFIDGDDEQGFSETGFFDGVFTFTKECQSTPNESGITTRLHKINHLVFGQITLAQTLSGTTIAELPDEFVPVTTTGTIINGEDSSENIVFIKATIAKDESTNKWCITVPSTDNLINGSRFWYTLN